MVATPAEVLARHPYAQLSHHEAAQALGIELVSSDWTPRLTVPRNRSRVQEPGWIVCRRDAPTRVLPDGTRVTQPAATVLDLATVLPLNEAVAAGDSALRKRLVAPKQMETLAAGLWGRGRREGRAVVALLDPRSGSVLESLLRVLLVTAGLPPPRSQAIIVDGDVEVARVDFCWRAQRLIVEADGFAFHSDRPAYRQDRERMNALERLGWRLLRFTWEDVVARPDHVVDLVRSCLAA